MAASNRQRMMSDPDGWAAEMEKRAELQEKMMTFMELQNNLMSMNRKYEGMLEELDQSEDDSAYSERYSNCMLIIKNMFIQKHIMLHWLIK